MAEENHTNAEAVEHALADFEPSPADLPYVALARSLAAALDDPAWFSAALAKEYRESLIALAGRMEAANASFTYALGQLDGRAAVGDRAL